MPQSPNFTTTDNLAAIVLAAGKGTRMKSPLPKVLHHVAGKPMLEHVIERLMTAGIKQQVLLLPPETEAFADTIARFPGLALAIQKERLGTGHAVASCAGAFEDVPQPHIAETHLIRGPKIQASHVIICAGDTPAIDPKVIHAFIDASRSSPLSVCGMRPIDPTGYGRLVLDETQTKLLAIVEEKDATPEQRTIPWCNSGIIWAETKFLFKLLNQIDNQNAQCEFYLTDCIELAHRLGIAPRVFLTAEWQSFGGVNTPEQRDEMESFMRQQS